LKDGRGTLGIKQLKWHDDKRTLEIKELEGQDDRETLEIKELEGWQRDTWEKRAGRMAEGQLR
jgi:hypothetical protein